MLSVYGWAGRAESILSSWYFSAAVGHSELVTGPSWSCELRRPALRRPNWIWLNFQSTDNKTTKASNLSVKLHLFGSPMPICLDPSGTTWLGKKSILLHAMLSCFFALTICGNPRFVYSLYVEAISLSPCGAHLKDREADLKVGQEKWHLIFQWQNVAFGDAQQHSSTAVQPSKPWGRLPLVAQRVGRSFSELHPAWLGRVESGRLAQNWSLIVGNQVEPRFWASGMGRLL